MADNTVIDAGSGGDTIADDDIGGVKYQRIKLVHGIDGTNDGDVANTNPLPVSARHSIVDTGLITIPGVVAAAYASGDVLGTICTIPNAARASGGSGRIKSIAWYDVDNVMGAIDLVFFNATATLAADNAVWTLADTEVIKILFTLPIMSMVTHTNNRFAQVVFQSGVDYVCAGTDLFLGVIQRSGPTLATGSASTPPSQRIRLTLERD